MLEEHVSQKDVDGGVEREEGGGGLVKSHFHVLRDVGALDGINCGGACDAREEGEAARRMRRLHWASSSGRAHMPEPAPTSRTVLPLKSLAFMNTGCVTESDAARQAAPTEAL